MKKVLDQIREWLDVAYQKYQVFNWWQQTLVWLGSFLLFVMIMDFLIMPLYTRHGNEYELPDVTELQTIDALKILDEQGFIPIVQDSTFDAYYGKGVVIRQNPAPYSTVKKGRRVYLVKSSGEKPLYMPDLVKRSFRHAELRLKELGLELNQIYLEFSEEIPHKDVVIRQSVPAGEQIRPGKKINLTLSLGPSRQSLEMPRLIGKSQDRALKELRAAGIYSDSIFIKIRYNPDLVPRTVIAQSVEEGTPIIEVGSLELTVSTDSFEEQNRQDR